MDRIFGARRLFVAATTAVACLLFVMSAPLAGRADETGSITITVTDATTHAALGLARVLLDGPVITSELTSPDGTVKFTDVPPGIYRARVAKSSYNAVTSAQFEVLEGHYITVSVALAKPAVRSLGTVTVRSTAVISSTTVDENSAARKLSDTLTDALGKLSGVTVSSDPNGDSDAQVTVSLDGHDPTQTGLTLDGVPLNAPGVAGDLRSINTDLFSSASTNFGPSAGALGGTVGFRSIEPTLTWQGKVTASYGTFGNAAGILSLSGTTGRIGIALTESSRGTYSALNGQTYLDASGLDYTHDGAALNDGTLLKIRAPLGSAQTLTATYVSTYGDTGLICNRFTGPVPCGYGPDNYSYNHLTFATLTDTALVGEVGLQFALFGTDSTYNRDLLNRYVAGIPDPFGTITDNRSTGATLNAMLPSRERHTLSIQATTSHAMLTTMGVISSTSPFSNASSSSDYSTIQLSDKINSSPKLTLGARLGMSFSPQTSNSVIGGASATWTPTSFDTFTGSVDIGGAGAGLSRTTPLTDPAALRFDCNASVGYGAGPGDLPGPTSSTSYSLTYARRLKTGQFALTLYQQLQNDVLLNTQVNGSVLPPGYFPPGYLALAQALYQSTSGCGAALPFGPTNLYISQPLAGIQRVYQGARFTAGFRIGQDLVAEPYYDITQTVANSASPLINNPYSLTISGAQVPSVPLHRGGLTLDYKAPRSELEYLLNGNFVSGNNSNNLPGYVTADAGVVLTLVRGSLTFAETNIFNKYGYDFASAANSVPIETVGGELLPTVARPLSPRQFSVTYTVKLGNTPQTNFTPALLAQTDTSGGTRRGGGFGPGGGGGPGGGFAGLAALPTSAPANPLDPDTSRQSCTADNAKAVKPLLDQIKAYVAAVDAAKTATGYPDAAPVTAPTINGLNVAYHKTPTSYALTFTQTKAGSVRSFISCAPLHVGSVDDAKALNLYIPPTSAFNRLPLAYAPEAGLYIVRPPQQAGQEQFRLYQLPTSPPTSPFALTSASTCTDELKPTATSLLGALQTYFATFDPNSPPATPPDGWTVVPHKTAGGYWTELQLADVSRIPAVLNCGHVSTGTPDQIKARKLDYARPPSLNYSPPLGLYLVRPNPGQSPQPQRP
jgi:hypothetical protein